MIKAIAFDFDGVLVADSEHYKDEAWEKVFAPYKGQYEPHLAEAKKRFGIGAGGDRYDILEYVYKKLIVPRVELPALIEVGGNTFDEYVQARILAADVVLGAREALEDFSKHFPCYVNSGTNTLALKRSICNLAIGQFFTGVFGGPASKAHNLKEIASLEKIEARQIIFIGDGEGDVRAAEEFGCCFVGLANSHNRWRDIEKPFPLVRHIKEVLQLFKHNYTAT